jgi:hypothetical protein
MNDERTAPVSDVESAAGQREETDGSAQPDGGSVWVDIDDIVWDAFGSGLSAAYD